MTDTLFLIASGLNAVASLCHLWVIYGGANEYRRFGAGEDMARMAEEGRLYPHILTFGIASALALFSYLCLSQAGLVPVPPFAPEILWMLTVVYLLRGIVPLVSFPWVSMFNTRFFVVSSAIVTAMGLVHLAALVL